MQENEIMKNELTKDRKWMFPMIRMLICIKNQIRFVAVSGGAWDATEAFKFRYDVSILQPLQNWRLFSIRVSIAKKEVAS